MVLKIQGFLILTAVDVSILLYPVLDIKFTIMFNGW